MAVTPPRGRHRLRGTTAGRAGLAARIASRLVLTIVAGLVLVGLAPYAIGWRPSVISSGSMMPVIAAGDVVVTAPAAPASIGPDDVIVFTDPAKPGHTIAHRVIARNPDGSFTTQGDANRTADSTPVPATAVHGLVRLRIPYVGLPRYWLTSRQWRPLVALCAVLAALVLCSGGPATPRPPAGTPAPQPDPPTPP